MRPARSAARLPKICPGHQHSKLPQPQTLTFRSSGNSSARLIQPPPARRTPIPIRVIVEGDEHKGLRYSPQPERAQVMKIARAIEDKARELSRESLHEVFDHPRRRGEPQPRTPFA